MEIEAKFSVPNRLTFPWWARLRRLASFTLSPAGTAQVADRYFDTPNRLLLKAGYACRLRREGDALLVTLKGTGGASGPIHRRDKRGVRLGAWNPDPSAWPDCPARDLALELASGESLQALFDLAQARTRSSLLDGDRRVAELSLDAVQVGVGWRPISYYELEAGLAPEGTEADLAAVVAELALAWGLAPEPRSKFDRGLQAVHGMIVARIDR